MSFERAKSIFADAKQHANPATAPVLFDLASGLAVLCEALAEMQAQIDALRKQ